MYCINAYTFDKSDHVQSSRKCNLNPFMPTVPTFAVRETDVSRHNGSTRCSPIMPRDAVSRTANVEANVELGINGLNKSYMEYIQVECMFIVCN